MQLHEKEMMRQHHEEMLNEHRELIDALTAEILLVREENIAMQVPSPFLQLARIVLLQAYRLRCIVCMFRK